MKRATRCTETVLPTSNAGKVRQCRNAVVPPETRCYLHGGVPGIRSLTHQLAVEHAHQDGAFVIGDALRLVRERSGKTMGDLARFLGVRVTVVSNIERGKLDEARALLAERPEHVALPSLTENPE